MEKDFPPRWLVVIGAVALVLTLISGCNPIDDIKAECQAFVDDAVAECRIQADEAAERAEERCADLLRDALDEFKAWFDARVGEELRAIGCVEDGSESGWDCSGICGDTAAFCDSSGTCY